MSNPLINISLERRILLVAIANKRAKVRAFVVARTTVDNFNSDVGKDVRLRLERRSELGKLPRAVEEMSDDPGLTKKARVFLSSAKKSDLNYAVNASIEQVEQLIKQLKQYSTAEKIYESISSVVEILKRGTYGEEEFDKVNKLIEDLAYSTKQTDNIQSFEISDSTSKKEAAAFIRSVMKVKDSRFVAFGIDALDSTLRGAVRGDLVVISAPRGGGKTAMMLQSASKQFSDYGLKVAIWSLEMSKSQLKERILAAVTGELFADVRVRKKNNIEYMKVLARKWFNFIKNSKTGGKLTIWDVSDAACKPQDLKKTVLPFNYDCIWVDYLTLFSSGGKDLWLAQKEYSRFFKQLAKELDTVVVLLTQLSDNERVKYGRGPEEDADWWLWWKYGEEEMARGGETEIKLAKARNAARGYVQATFDMPTMQVRFGNIISPISRYTSVMNKMQRNSNKATNYDDIEI